MNNGKFVGLCGAAVLAGLVLLGLAPTRAAAADAPIPAAPAAPPVPVAALPNQAQIDRQLKAAQKQLQQAAHEVARLSTELSGKMLEGMTLDGMMPLVGPHAVIGVQVERGPNDIGARVRSISPGGPAAEAGIQVEDLIVAFNGIELKGVDPARQISGIVRGVQPDATVSVRVLRHGKPLDLSVTARGGPGAFASGLEEFDFDFPQLPDMFGHRPLRDLELATLTPRLGSYFGSDKGVLVVRAPADGTLRLEDGDVILAIDGREPKNGSHATRILSSYQSGEKVTLRIIRQHKTFDLEATLPLRTTPRETSHRETAGAPPAGATRAAVICGSDEARRTHV